LTSKLLIHHFAELGNVFVVFLVVGSFELRHSLLTLIILFVLQGLEFSFVLVFQVSLQFVGLSLVLGKEVDLNLILVTFALLVPGLLQLDHQALTLGLVLIKFIFMLSSPGVFKVLCFT